ncbi:MAG: YbjN domain-containing protein [Synechococcus sp.]
MNAQSYQLDNPLSFHCPAETQIDVRAVELQLKIQAESVRDCRLHLHVDWLSYCQIDSQALFGLKPEFKGRLAKGKFRPELPVQLIVALSPDYFSIFDACVARAVSVAEYLFELYRTQPSGTIFDAENWYALSVKQKQHNRTIGFRTFWDYLDISQISSENFELDNDFAIDAVVKFFQDSASARLVSDLPTGANKAKLTKALNRTVENLLKYSPNDNNGDEGVFDPIAETFGLLGELIPNDATEVIRQATIGNRDLSELLQSLDLTEAISDQPQSGSERLILAKAIAFFKEDDWEFEEIPGKSILRMLYQGQHDRLLCFAEAKEDLQQFIFYSTSSVKVPSNNRSAACELMMKINNHLTVGNLELDFQDGEIRFRTSIDVEGSRLDTALVKNIAYTNVLTMDKFIPSLLTVANGSESVNRALSILFPSVCIDP